MKKTLILSLIMLVSVTYPRAQSFTSDQKQQGYAAFGDKVTFIFDQETYQVKPERVVITGEFRNWDQNMEDLQWQLVQTGEQWLLSVDNTDFNLINPNSKFKFRINQGEWLDPPANAPNVSGSDLVFMPGVKAKSLTAELLPDGMIWADVSINRPLAAESYRLTNAAGREIAISGVLPNGSTTTLLRPAEKLDRRRVYYLEIPSQNLKTPISYDGWFRTTYSTKELGANIHDGGTEIRLFAPRAEAIVIYLYEGKDDTEAYRHDTLVVDESGVWEITYDEDLHGVYYDFTIHGASDPGNMFFETHSVHFTDPYARVSDDTWGKARIWRATTPASPLANGIPPMEDIIAYEVHVQDFTDLLPVDDQIKGTFPAMTQRGLRNSRGEKIGFDYLLDLGINVVHLMPVQEYLHFPDDDWKASFSDDEYMISQGISEENYQWGYRTSHAMAVESKYRTRGKEPGAERDEFRDLVQAFHDQGIAVIIDIVPNHTAENMDGNGWLFNFNAIDKQYYYRTKDFEHIGAYGNEVKTENRPMTQRWVIDQCLYFINEFGIDGFRIDLAGQIDEQTLIALKDAIGHDKILYGEPWIGSNDPAYEANPDWDWYKADAPITFFQDDSRNAFKGPVFELNDYQKDRGWPGGKFDERENVMKGLQNTFPDDKTPVSGISYLDIHDNFALADQFGGPSFDGRTSVDQDRYKIAATLLYTTLGPIVTHGGSEMMRSKADAPLGEVVKKTNAGFDIYLHGYRDTYNHRFANQFKWENVGKKPEAGNTNDYENMHAFWKGLNAFRLSEAGEVFRKAERVEDNYYHWILPENESQLGYIVNREVIVLLNAGDQAGKFDFEVPEGKWKLIADNDQVNHEKKISGPKLKAGQAAVEVPATGLYIWIKESD